MKQSNRIPCYLDWWETYEDALPIGCFRLAVCHKYPTTHTVTSYFTELESAERIAWQAMTNNAWSYSIDCLNHDGRWLPWLSYNPIDGFKRYPTAAAY